MHYDSPLPLDEVTLNRCQDPPPVPVVTTVAPVGEQQALYIAGSDRLYAVNASNGAEYWHSHYPSSPAALAVAQ